MNLRDVAVVFFLSWMFGGWTVRRALKAILRLNVGRKHKYREIQRGQTVLARITMSYLPAYVEKRRTLCLILLTMNYAYMATMSVFVGVLLMSMFGLPVLKVANALLWAKVLLFDVPLILFQLVCTGHNDKHGGVEWKL